MIKNFPAVAPKFEEKCTRRFKTVLTPRIGDSYDAN